MWNDLAAVTNDRILKFRPHPPGWCVYLNAAFTVESPEFSPAFNEEARRCQRAWLRTMNRTLGNKNRKHFAINADFLTRQLAHSGMLIISGNIIPPHDWTSMEKELQFAGISKRRTTERGGEKVISTDLGKCPTLHSQHSNKEQS